jgi:hypothetical protein
VRVARFRDMPEPEKEELMEEAAAAEEDILTCWSLQTWRLGLVAQAGGGQ